MLNVSQKTNFLVIQITNVHFFLLTFLAHYHIASTLQSPSKPNIILYITENNKIIYLLLELFNVLSQLQILNSLAHVTYKN